MAVQTEQGLLCLHMVYGPFSHTTQCKEIIIKKSENINISPIIIYLDVYMYLPLQQQLTSPSVL